MPDIYRIATICAYGLAGALFAIVLQTCPDAHYWDTRPWTSLFVSAGIPLSLAAALLLEMRIPSWYTGTARIVSGGLIAALLLVALSGMLFFFANIHLFVAFGFLTGFMLLFVISSLLQVFQTRTRRQRDNTTPLPVLPGHERQSPPPT